MPVAWNIESVIINSKPKLTRFMNHMYKLFYYTTTQFLIRADWFDLFNIMYQKDTELFNKTYDVTDLKYHEFADI